jgi:hypothetical protein
MKAICLLTSIAVPLWLFVAIEFVAYFPRLCPVMAPAFLLIVIGVAVYLFPAWSDGA